jgi:FlaA1/EpsC-like NDP-sugar epimerase
MSVLDPPSGGGRVAASSITLEVMADAAIVGVAVVAAYLLRFEKIPPEPYLGQMLLVAPALALVRLGTNRVLGIHRMSWRFFGLREATLVAAAVGCVSVLLVAWRIVQPSILPSLPVVPLGVLALEAMLSLAGYAGVRMLARIVHEHERREARRRRSGQTMRRALLVGAGRAGRLAAKELRDRPDAGYQVVGFLDDDARRHRQLIEGVPVLGATREVGAIAARVRAEVIILTMPSVTRAIVREIVERCQQQAGLPVHTVPGLWELLSRRVEITKIRPLSVPDLLGRDVIEFCARSWSRVLAAYRGKTLLVTGAGGSIGSELCRQLADLEPRRLILLESNENNLFDIDNEIRARLGDRTVACLADIRNRAQLLRVFERWRPEVIFHAAAFKHVPMMELHPPAAIDNNVRGTRVLAEVADAMGVERMLFVSTDKAVNPTNVMGASKRMAEMVVQARARTSRTRFCVVRFGNVLGSRGSVLHTFQRQLEAGGPITLTHPDVTRFFMTIPEAVRLVIQAQAVSDGGELFLLEMGEPIRIFDLATQMIRLSGLSLDDVPIEIVGLRPGEKLHEELLRPDEGTKPSPVDGVLVAEPAAIEGPKVWRIVEQLEAAADAGDHETIRALLGKATSYRPPAIVGVQEAS